MKNILVVDCLKYSSNLLVRVIVIFQFENLLLVPENDAKSSRKGDRKREGKVEGNILVKEDMIAHSQSSE